MTRLEEIIKQVGVYYWGECHFDGLIVEGRYERLPEDGVITVRILTSIVNGN